MIAPGAFAQGSAEVVVPTAPFASAAPRLKPAAELTRPKPADLPGSNFFLADRVDGDQKNGVVEAAGNVVFRNRKQTVRADWARYTEGIDTLDARGNVTWRSLYDSVQTDALNYSPSTERGTAGKTQYVLSRFGSQGTAERVRLEGEGKYGMDIATYTTCKSQYPAWCLTVDKLDLDADRDVGTAKGAVVRFFDIPVFYWPSLEFPLGKERKSGFLTPTYGSTGTRGFELHLPYYLNLAPNFDATITPRVMTKRGLQLNGEFRYLMDGVEGTLLGEFLPRDRVVDANRSRLHWRHSQEFLPRLHLAIDAQRVSDDTYFVDLSDRVAATAISTVPRFATLSYHWNEWDFLLRVQKFQTLQDPTAFVAFTPPYEKVPELSAHRIWRDLYGFEASVDSAVTRFQHPFLAPGVRSLFVGNMKYPWRSPGAFIIPQATLHASDYRLDTTDLDFRDTTRVIPIASLDAGLLFERDTSLFGNLMHQTLEPRIFYTYIPFKSQAQIPNFDSAPIDFNYAQLFQENRYSGYDRVGDANQVTIALTTRYLESTTGRERVRFSLGERFYFRDQQINVGEIVRERSTSDLLAILGISPNEKFNAEATMQFNTNSSRTERATLLARYSPEPRKVISASARYIRGLVENGATSQVKQIDVAGQWPMQSLIGPIGRGFYGVARVNYAVTENRVVEAIGGFEYDGDCWIGRLVAQRIATGVQKATNSIFWQIELNGLSRVGTNPLEVLRRNIPGYQTLSTLETGRRRGGQISDVFQPLD